MSRVSRALSRRVQSVKQKNFQDISLLLVVIVVAGIGTYLLAGSHAATPSVNANADGGNLSDGAAIVRCEVASDNNCVSFLGTSTGKLFAWGLNDSGQLGLGTKGGVDTPIPEPVQNFTDVSQIIGINSNQRATLVLLKDGSIIAWGGNVYGQLGTGDENLKGSPTTVKVSGLSSGVTQISGDTSHVMALLSNGTVYAWGSNLTGTLGNGTVGTPSGGAHCPNCVAYAPIQVAGLSNVVAISAGFGNDLALLSNGTVMAWGSDNAGELGTNPDTTVQTYRPTLVPGLTHVKTVVAGAGSIYALLDNGTVMDWGQNDKGQLGNGTTASSYTPATVPGLSGVTTISAGDSGQVMALLQNGTVVSWGYNGDGELGIGSTPASCTNKAGNTPQFCSMVPVQVPGLSGVTTISAGNQYDVAVAGGNVYAWGDPKFANLGTGSRNPSNVPVELPGLTGISHVFAGFDHTLAY